MPFLVINTQAVSMFSPHFLFQKLSFWHLVLLPWMLSFSKAYWLAAKDRPVHTLPFFQHALLLHRDRQYSQKEGKKTLTQSQCVHIGWLPSCQFARTKPQEEVKMLSNSWEVNKSAISIRIKQQQQQQLGFIVYEFLFCHPFLNYYVPGEMQWQLQEEWKMAFICVQTSFPQTFFFYILETER